MRILVITATVFLLVSPTDARPRKRTRTHTAPAPAQVVPNDRAAKEHARAEAELADVRAGRVGDDPQAATEPAHEPAQPMVVQENDREVPAPLRKKR
jgi:hypothetical protein